MEHLAPYRPSMLEKIVVLGAVVQLSSVLTLPWASMMLPVLIR